MCRHKRLAEEVGGDLAAGLEGEVGGAGELLEVEEGVEEAGVVYPLMEGMESMFCWRGWVVGDGWGVVVYVKGGFGGVRD